MVIGQTNGRSWQVIGTTTCNGKTMPLIGGNPTLAKTPPVATDMARWMKAGLKFLHDGVTLSVLVNSGDEGCTIESVCDVIGLVCDDTIRNAIARMSHLGLVEIAGRTERKPWVVVYRATATGHSLVNVKHIRR